MIEKKLFAEIGAGPDDLERKTTVESVFYTDSKKVGVLRILCSVEYGILINLDALRELITDVMLTKTCL